MPGIEKSQSFSSSPLPREAVSIGGSEDLENLSKLETTDKNIQKITKTLSYCLLGIGSSKVLAFRETKLDLLKNLSLSSNTNTLKKVHEVATKEFARLGGHSSDSYQNRMSLEYNSLIENCFSYVEDKKNIVINAGNVKVKQPGNGRVLEFAKHHKTEPHFAFTLQVGTRTLDLKGLGEGKDNRIKATGAFGRVFFGTDQNGKKVAVKVATSPNGIEALKKEGDFLSQTYGCDNVVGASEVGYSNGNPPLMFVVMEHIEGEEFADKLGDKTNSMETKPKIAALRDIASGLQQLHDQGIVHRDLKPANVFIDNETGKARILDLGLSASSEIGKQEEGFSGSLRYMSPETIAKKAQGGKSDTYSFGLMTHEMFSSSGREPAYIKDIGKRLKRRMKGDIKVSPDDYPSSIPEQTREQIADLVNSCLKLKPYKRSSDRELITRLNVIMENLN
jgi:predicted Ser/Thr protein kinase